MAVRSLRLVISWVKIRAEALAMAMLAILEYESKSIVEKGEGKDDGGEPDKRGGGNWQTPPPALVAATVPLCLPHQHHSQ